ncbi:hypothetical protein EV127DRAFT_412839 [Xylaria flabelliformis]|nr:hypothetical protein EV127DRAFT_412839 [Xylaria flabelliformis]
MCSVLFHRKLSKRRYKRDPYALLCIVEGGNGILKHQRETARVVRLMSVALTLSYSDINLKLDYVSSAANHSLWTLLSKPRSTILLVAQLLMVIMLRSQFRNLTLLDANNDINMRDITSPPWGPAVDGGSSSGSISGNGDGSVNNGINGGNSGGGFNSSVGSGDDENGSQSSILESRESCAGSGDGDGYWVRVSIEEEHIGAAIRDQVRIPIEKDIGSTIRHRVTTSSENERIAGAVWEHSYTSIEIEKIGLDSTGGQGLFDK